jgi:hypothetical protein
VQWAAVGQLGQQPQRRANFGGIGGCNDGWAGYS